MMRTKTRWQGGWVAEGSIAATTDLDGFQHIDDLIEWCAEFGLWISLDMHAAPGSQGVTLAITDGFYPNNLWDYPVFQDVLVEIWDAISDRYRDESRIAMYEFINEPNSVPGGGPAIRDLTQRLITMVRDKGDQHLIGVHGNGYSNVYDNMLPQDFSPNWGLVYHAHRYWIDPQDDAIPNGNPNVINRMVDLVQFRQTHQVPIWVSEDKREQQRMDGREHRRHGSGRRGLVPLDVEAPRCLSERGPQSDWWELSPRRQLRHEHRAGLDSPQPDHSQPRHPSGDWRPTFPHPEVLGAPAMQTTVPPIGSIISLQGFHGEYVNTNGGIGDMTCDSGFGRTGQPLCD